MGQEKLQIIDPSSLKSVGAFGGGIAASGGTCGTLLGGVSFISNMYSRANLDEKEDPRMWSLSQKFLKKFEELTKECGGLNCRDIAQVDWSDRNAVKEYYNNPKSSRMICSKLVGDAAFALGEILEKETSS